MVVGDSIADAFRKIYVLWLFQSTQNQSDLKLAYMSNQNWFFTSPIVIGESIAGVKFLGEALQAQMFAIHSMDLCSLASLSHTDPGLKIMTAMDGPIRAWTGDLSVIGRML